MRTFERLLKYQLNMDGQTLRFYGIWICCLVLAHGLWAQASEHSALLEGTQAYQQGNYRSAIDYFGTAIDHNNQSHQGHYNLGNAFYKAKRYDEAATQFQRAKEQAPTSSDAARALYNLGNTRLAQAQQPDQGTQSETGDHLNAAIDAYKQALRLNPRDYDAKNNLATAYKLLRQQQPPPNPKDQPNPDQDPKDQEEQEEQDNQEQQNQQEQSQDSNQEQQNQPDPPQEQPQSPQEEKKAPPASSEPREMTVEEAKRLLERIEEDDKRVQRRLLEQKRSKPTNIEKKW